MPDHAGTYAAFVMREYRWHALHLRTAGQWLPRDNRTRLYLRGPARHHLARPVRNAHRHAANLDPADLDHWCAATAYWFSRYMAEMDTLSRDAFDTLLARQTAHHKLVAGLARRPRVALPAGLIDRPRARPEEPRTAAPPGPGLVARSLAELVARSLAPHAPPAPARCRIARGAAT